MLLSKPNLDGNAMYLNPEIYNLHTTSRLAAPLNHEPIDWFMDRLMERLELIAETSYCGPLPNCQEAIDKVILDIKQWVYSA